jgi:peptide/nickel transport system substrate-binding protein
VGTGASRQIGVRREENQVTAGIRSKTDQTSDQYLKGTDGMEKQIRDFTEEYKAGRIERSEFLKWAALLGVSIPLLRVPVVRAAVAGPVRGGTIKVASGNAVSIDPPLLIDGAGIGIAQQYGEYLVDVGADLVPRPKLATSWTPSQNGLVWTVKVRQGVKFHSGKTLNADDVVATFKRLVDPKGTSTAKSSLSFLTPEGVTKIDDYTVQFTLTRPVVDFAYYLNTYQAIIIPTSYSGSIVKNPDGTGPFKLVEYVPGQRVRFVRNPDYWNKPLPYLDGVEVVLGFASGSDTTALLSGTVDTVIVTDYTHIQLLQGNPNIVISTTRSSGHDGVFLRTDKAPFTDVRVRQAFALAFDRPTIIKTLDANLAVLGNDNVIAPVFPVYAATAQRAKNIAKAKALLAAAGFAKGLSAPILTAADGQIQVLQTEQTPSLITYFSNISRPVSAKLRNVHADPANYLDLSQAYFVK